MRRAGYFTEFCQGKIMTEKIVLGWCDGTLRDGGNSEKTNGVLSKSSDLEPNSATVD